jgi:hypothetical protein
MPPKFNGNTPTYHQSLMEILQHIQKSLMEIPFGCMVEYFLLTLLVWWIISIKLWLYVGVFTLNFGGMLEYLH